MPWQFRDYNLADYEFSTATLAAQLLGDLAELADPEYPPLPPDPQPTAFEIRAAAWIWRRLDMGGELTAPEINAIFTTGKFEYQPVRIPVLVLEILRQAEKAPGTCFAAQRQGRLARLAGNVLVKWYLAYGHYLLDVAPTTPTTLLAPISVFLQ